MFIDKEWKKETSKIPDSPQEIKQKNYLMYFVVGIAAIGAMFLFIFLMKNPSERGAIVLRHESDDGASETASSTLGLPDDFGNGDESQYSIGSSTDSIRAEDLTFGNFYEKPKDSFYADFKSYSLPINVKIDVSNYYDISRKINLDPYVESLNKNGFAIINAPSELASGDFFSAYRDLLGEDIPIFLTEDFLIYYYQNTLKQVFEEIEKNSFYETVWDINKKLYDISLARYRKDLSDLGLVNDPVLEGERLELAYFAVALKILEPTNEQINQKVNFSDDSKFTLQDAENFSFEMPDYLSDDVNREVKLIRESRIQTKSPVMLYQKNYADFVVPGNYVNNAKLNNFYLTLKWLNTVFPMYYRDGNCENCTLDRDDWIINMVAAGNISKDMYENQDLKNEWAIIYKFLSFFSGLRTDLTYLNYHDVYSELFGDDYNIRGIFSRDSKNRNESIKLIQDKLSSYKFSSLEGSLDRSDKEKKPLLGMRLLQEAYWPNYYLLNYLTGQELTNPSSERSTDNVTYCQDRYSTEYFRCNGFAYDILNMIYPVNEDYNLYFYANTKYSGYQKTIDDLRSEIDKFDIYTWNNNIYWTTLDVVKSLLYDDRNDRPIYTRSQAWLEQRDYNTFLSAWTNLHLSDDIFVGYYESSNTNLGSFLQCNKYNYIEPNINLVKDLISRNNMLVKMLKILETGDKTSTASASLKELNKKLANVSDIIEKELNNETIDDEDCRFITDFVKQIIEEKGEREFVLTFKNEFTGRGLRESIQGIKFLAVVYQHEDKKIISLGPIFNFKEN